MSYFKDFPIIEYKFGDETNPDRFRNISIYADVLDTIKGDVSFYEKYYIGAEERPDQTSFKLYKTSSLAWTFFLLNDHLRERGWPLTNRELSNFAISQYPHVVITTRDPLYDRFRIGQEAIGTVSGARGIITYRNLDLGQVAIAGANNEFQPGEIVNSFTIVDTPLKAINTIESIVCFSNGPEYLAAKYYRDSNGDMLDLNPAIGPGPFDTEVTYYEDLSTKNDELKSINVLKPESVNSIVRAFKQAVSIE